MAYSSLATDMVGQSASGEVVLAVEVKNQEGLDAKSAAVLRRNLLSHGMLSDAPYFLMVSQEFGYLWLPNARHDAELLPDYSFDMTAVVDRYVNTAGSGGRLRGAELEIIVFDWLAGLQEGQVRPDTDANEAERVLTEAGLLTALRGGTISRYVDAA